MALHTWWWFLATVFVLCGTPGPNMLHILGRSVGLGFRRSVPAMAGCLLAMLLVLAASAAGLSAVLRSSPMLFDVLRYLGVAYLAWLGIKAWRDSYRQAPVATDVDAAALPPVHGAWAVFRGGLLVGLSNPKLLLFAAAFLPQFVDPARGPVWSQVLVLGAILGVLGFAMDCLYAVVSAAAAGRLRIRGGGGGKVTGGVYLVLGAAAALTGGRH